MIGVTGASGLIGRHLLALLARNGHAVTATSRCRPEADVAWYPSELAEWRHPDQLDGLFAHADAVVHLGAALPGADAAALMDVNLRATLVLGQWAASRDKPLIFLSSGSVYGETTEPVDEDAPMSVRPLGGLYGLSKQLAEQALAHLAAQGLLRTVIRPTAVYGWGMPGGKLVADFLARARAGDVLEVAPPAADSVNLVHAFDVARAVAAVLEAPSSGVFNVAGPGQVSVGDLARACVRVAGSGSVRELEGEAGRPPVDRFRLKGSRAAAALGYTPRVGLEEGLGLMLHQACLPEGGLP
ncbi:Putative UDP-glucuronic acid decarboxylase 1 [Magnetospirillum sp. XM-1]|uniref:NAD-dependent epimerase/dehydratase family protein n=1 Tax=Magnetospirillum sp. XM-1 TaxID=1663591 RepID=UPI00073DDED7|nr:NAD(P)-dependent oxidoreductase [Magnetospirillum sp. XM-1]CUW38029.1 Putative UDP-glucuronic acid decarboxylase 1 [Magnetospirillum sp. XM-1]